MLPFVLAAAIACLAFFVRGFSGFGSALVMTPLLALVFDPHLAVTSTAMRRPPRCSARCPSRPPTTGTGTG